MSVNEAVAADVFDLCDDGVAYTLGNVVTYKEVNGCVLYWKLSYWL